MARIHSQINIQYEFAAVVRSRRKSTKTYPLIYSWIFEMGTRMKSRSPIETIIQYHSSILNGQTLQGIPDSLCTLADSTQATFCGDLFGHFGKS
jgi:hypothetical protein